MAKFRVKQIVLCEVEVVYNIEATDMYEALDQVIKIDTPTCADGRDFEIISDVEIKSTHIAGE